MMNEMEKNINVLQQNHKLHNLSY